MKNKTEIIFIVISVIMILAAGIFRTVQNERSKNPVITIKPSDVSQVQPGTGTMESSAVSTTTTQIKTTAAKTSTTLQETTVTSTVTTAVTTEKPEITEEIIPENISEDEFVYIDINLAGREDFMKLSGIGEYLADNIVNYREINGYFRNIEEIMLVSGIGERIFEKICDNIYVENPVYEEYPEPEEFYEEPEIIPEISDEIISGEPIFPININTADTYELLWLPNVTEESAAEIIKLREDLGGYSNSYELLYVTGLSKQQVAEIVELVTVE